MMRADPHDISVPGIAAGAALIVAGIVFSLWLSWVIVEMRHANASGANQPVPGAARVVQAPTLESAPHADLHSYERAKRARLNGYGWVDRKAGRVHIPIALAMQILEQRRAGRGKRP